MYDCFNLIQGDEPGEFWRLLGGRPTDPITVSIHSFILAFNLVSIPSYIHSFTLEFINSSIHSFICSFVCSHSFIHSFIHSFVRSFIHSCILKHSCIYPFIHYYLFLTLQEKPEYNEPPPVPILYQVALGLGYLELPQGTVFGFSLVFMGLLFTLTISDKKDL